MSAGLPSGSGSDTAAQYQLALDWFRLGQKAQGRMQQEITSRAAFWYRIAEPKMSALQREAVPDDFRDAISTPTEVVSESDPGSTTKPLGESSMSASLRNLERPLRPRSLGHAHPLLAVNA